VAAAYERVSIGIGSHWPFDQWGRFLPEHTTAVSMLDRLLHHGVVVVTDGESFRMKEARQRSAGVKSPRGAPPTKTTTKEVTDKVWTLAGGAVSLIERLAAGAGTDDRKSTEHPAIAKQTRQEGWVLLLATSGYRKLAVDTAGIGATRDLHLARLVNAIRLHSSTEYCPPIEYEEIEYEENLAAQSF